MAEVYSDIATVEKTPTPGSPLVAAKFHGKTRVVQASYEAAALAAASIINICKLRKGDIVLMNSFAMFDALGAGTSLDVGDNDSAGADADRYADGIVTTSAEVFQFNDVAACIDKVPYIVQNDCWLQATLLGAEGAGTIKFTIFIARAGA